MLPLEKHFINNLVIRMNMIVFLTEQQLLPHVLIIDKSLAPPCIIMFVSTKYYARSFNIMKRKFNTKKSILSALALVCANGITLSNAAYAMQPQNNTTMLENVQVNPFPSTKDLCWLSSGLSVLNLLNPNTGFNMMNLYWYSNVQFGADKPIDPTTFSIAMKKALDFAKKKSIVEVYYKECPGWVLTCKNDMPDSPVPELTDENIGTFFEEKLINSSIDTIIKNYIDIQNTPLICEIDPAKFDPEVFGDSKVHHLIVILGYKEDSSGKITDVIVNFNTNTDLRQINIDGTTNHDSNSKNIKCVSIEKFNKNYKTLFAVS